jgi:hypothetical protein
MPPRFGWEKLQGNVSRQIYWKRDLSRSSVWVIVRRWRSEVWREGVRLEGVSMTWDHQR